VHSWGAPICLHRSSEAWATHQPKMMFCISMIQLLRGCKNVSTIFNGSNYDNYLNYTEVNSTSNCWYQMVICMNGCFFYIYYQNVSLMRLCYCCDKYSVLEIFSVQQVNNETSATVYVNLEFCQAHNHICTSVFFVDQCCICCVSFWLLVKN